MLEAVAVLLHEFIVSGLSRLHPKDVWGFDVDDLEKMVHYFTQSMLTELLLPLVHS